MKQVSRKNKIKSFTDLIAWKKGHSLVIIIYKITKTFPKEEVFGLVSQMQRCAVSITSNLAEGFSRFSSKQKKQFYSIALGSVTELQNQILVAKDIGYLKKEDFKKVAQKTVEVHKLINGLIKSSQSLTHDA